MPNGVNWTCYIKFRQYKKIVNVRKTTDFAQTIYLYYQTSHKMIHLICNVSDLLLWVCPFGAHNLQGFQGHLVVLIEVSSTRKSN